MKGGMQQIIIVGTEKSEKLGLISKIDPAAGAKDKEG